jgi:hypothetical protein
MRLRGRVIIGRSSTYRGYNWHEVCGVEKLQTVWRIEELTGRRGPKTTPECSNARHFLDPGQYSAEPTDWVVSYIPWRDADCVIHDRLSFSSDTSSMSLKRQYLSIKFKYSDFAEQNHLSEGLNGSCCFYPSKLSSFCIRFLLLFHTIQPVITSVTTIETSFTPVTITNIQCKFPVRLGV